MKNFHMNLIKFFIMKTLKNYLLSLCGFFFEFERYLFKMNVTLMSYGRIFESF
jgi:hypothetical protein